MAAMVVAKMSVLRNFNNSKPHPIITEVHNNNSNVKSLTPIFKGFEKTFLGTKEF